MTFTRCEMINKRHEMTFTRRDMTVSSLKASPFSTKVDGKWAMETARRPANQISGFDLAVWHTRQREDQRIETVRFWHGAQTFGLESRRNLCQSLPTRGKDGFHPVPLGVLAGDSFSFVYSESPLLSTFHCACCLSCSAIFKLFCAATNEGSSRTAVWNSASAASSRFCFANATPRLLCAGA